MKFKNFFLSFFLIIFLSVGCGKDHDKPVQPTVSQEDSVHAPHDMVLIYDGDPIRIPWNKNQLHPYLYQKRDGKLSWLFDSFLFLEIFFDINNTRYSFVVNNNPADKELWETLVERTFADNTGPKALEQLLDSLKSTGDVPPYKRKVVLSIPNPAYGFENWGELDGKALDFYNSEDRIKAAEWYINRVLIEWNYGNFKNLELDGFYWVREAVANQSDVDLIKAVSKYVHNKGFHFYHIPYYGAGRAGDWKELGFDMAYQQPNYFFDLSTPLSRLPAAIDFAKAHDMGLEMEFDGNLMSSADYMEKFYDYLHKFDELGVWENRDVAYYEGGGAWLRMSTSTKPEVMKAFKDLSDIIIKRENN